MFEVESGTDQIKISPTDISQFIRLEQCQRYLRLRLHERAHGREFLEEYGVYPQTIPPLLTRSGQSFEDRVEHSVREHYPSRNFTEGRKIRRDSDNDAVAQLAQELLAGETRVLFQARLSLPLGNWWFRGDIDILRLERDEEGTLHVVIADMKSSAEAKMEHRLQVAFYHEMLTALLTEKKIAHGEIRMGILYRGTAVDTVDLSAKELARLEEEHRQAAHLFGVEDALLEITADPQSYIDSVQDLVTGDNSTAHHIATESFDALPYHLTHKCDGCLYNEFCMKYPIGVLSHIAAVGGNARRSDGTICHK